MNQSRIAPTVAQMKKMPPAISEKFNDSRILLIQASQLLDVLTLKLGKILKLLNGSVLIDQPPAPESRTDKAGDELKQLHLVPSLTTSTEIVILKIL